MEQASVTARYAANASRFLKTLAIVGIFTDAFVFAFDVRAPNIQGQASKLSYSIQAYEEHQQTVGLENAVKQLYTSRIVAKVFSRSCDVIQSLVRACVQFESRIDQRLTLISERASAEFLDHHWGRPSQSERGCGTCYT